MKHRRLTRLPRRSSQGTDRTVPEPESWMLWSTDGSTGNLQLSCHDGLVPALHEAWIKGDIRGECEVDCLEGGSRRFDPQEIDVLIDMHRCEIEELHVSTLSACAVYVTLPQPYAGDRLVGTYDTLEEAEAMAERIRSSIGPERVTTLAM